MKQEDKDRLAAMVDSHVSQLAEHVDTVQVFIQKHDDDGGNYTMSYEKGAGNFYARHGQIYEWLIMQEEFQRAEGRRRDANQHED